MLVYVIPKMIVGGDYSPKENLKNGTVDTFMVGGYVEALSEKRQPVGINPHNIFVVFVFS